MKRRIAAYIHKHTLLQKDGVVLVALSGGADSVALLHILLALGYSCEAAHCNFHLRGEESDRDEDFVQKWCAQLGVSLHIRHFDTQTYAQAKGISIEMAARELRYDWFESLREERNYQAIAVAHHENDQVETLLLNLQRGCGLRGLEGMHPRNGYVVRPLLGTSREAIMHYLTIHRLQHVEDSTNGDTVYQRNAIRQQLQHYSQAQIRNMAETCGLMQGYEEMVNAYVAQAKEKVVTPLDKGIRIAIEALLRMPAAETLLYELLREYGFNQTEQIYTALNGESGRRFYSDEYQAIIDRKHLLILPKDNNEEGVPELNINIRKRNKKETYFPSDAWECLFDGHIADKHLTLRHWQEGDWFIPIGMRGKKKLSDFFTDMKLSLADKEKIWVLCADEDIAWVVGYRMDDRYKVFGSSTYVVHVTVQKR